MDTKQILDAATRLAGHAHVTPIMTSATLDEMLGAQVYFKCENFQKVGAFKYRGAYNAISQLSDEERARGVITYSSGNHAQAVARVASELGINAVIVMPDNSPAVKRQAGEGYGADVIIYDTETETREVVARELQEQHGYTLVPPFDHEHVIAGQGTSALELMQEVSVDTLLVPCGGGGVLCGSAIAAKHLNPDCEVIGIEPELADDAARSFRTGKLHSVRNPPTIADGTRTPSMSDLTLSLAREHVDDIRTVTEQAIMRAVEFFFYRMKLVVEPSGGLGLAALLSEVVEARGRVGVIVTGGNVDATTFCHILSSAVAQNE